MSSENEGKVKKNPIKINMETDAKKSELVQNMSNNKTSTILIQSS